MFNLLLETAIETGASLALTHLLGHPPFRTSTTLPLPFAIIKQLGWLYVAREILTYTTHRTVLHAHRPGFLSRSSSSGSRRLPAAANKVTSKASSKAKEATGYIARQHAAYAHADDAAPYSLALAADHPVPFLLHRFVPIYIPALLVRPHLLVYFLFVGLITFEETLTMSGYTIVPGIIMGGIARRNAAHYSAGHRGSDSGNYGAWGVIDWVSGTSGLPGSGGDIDEDVRAEAAKHRVKERGQRRASNALEAVRGGIEGVKKGKGRAKGRRGGRDSGSD